MRRHERPRGWQAARVGVIGLAVLGLVLARPTGVAAECSFVPPWPPITAAIPSAREIVVGEVITVPDPDALAAETAPRIKALFVTAVLRGERPRGESFTIEWLLPNWPWTKSSDGTPAIPSCSYLQAEPGETIAIAFDAFHPGSEVETADDVSWYQPPTRYNAMGVIVSADPTSEWGADREQVSVEQLERLAGLPASDSGTNPTEPPSRQGWMIGLVAGLAAVVIAISWPGLRSSRRP